MPVTVVVGGQLGGKGRAKLPISLPKRLKHALPYALGDQIQDIQLLTHPVLQLYLDNYPLHRFSQM